MGILILFSKKKIELEYLQVLHISEHFWLEKEENGNLRWFTK